MDKVLFTQLSIPELRNIIREEQLSSSQELINQILKEKHSLPDEEKNRYLNKKEAGAVANVCTSTIDNWIRAGFIKKYKLGEAVRIKYTDLINYIESLAA